MIDRAHDLPIAKQAEALNISRGSVYYLPRPVSETDSRSCAASTGCIWSAPSPARGCCEACWLPRGARSAGVT
jgi:putative transposase